MPNNANIQHDDHTNPYQAQLFVSDKPVIPASPPMQLPHSATTKEHPTLSSNQQLTSKENRPPTMTAHNATALTMMSTML